MADDLGGRSGGGCGNGGARLMRHTCDIDINVNTDLEARLDFKEVEDAL
jgi:hypothetical protein